MKIFKKRQKMEYTFLCKICDIFFTNFALYENKCPICGRRGEVYKVEPVKINSIFNMKI